MRANLNAEHERLERALDDALNAPRDSLAAGSNATEISTRIQALEAEMREHTVEFELQALSRLRYAALRDAHPGKDGAVVDPDSFFPALIRACTTSPPLSDEVWALLLDEQLTDQQYDSLVQAAMGLNRRDVDVPFSRRASRLMERVEPDSNSPSDSESASDGSSAGSPSASPSTSTTKRAGSSGRSPRSRRSGTSTSKR